MREIKWVCKWGRILQHIYAYVDKSGCGILEVSQPVIQANLLNYLSTHPIPHVSLNRPAWIGLGGLVGHAFFFLHNSRPINSKSWPIKICAGFVSLLRFFQ